MRLSAALLFCACACSSEAPPVELEDLPDPPIHTPRWAFAPWISKDISDGADTRAFVDGFRARDIPVGVVVLDSPWETNYNTLIPSPTRYPGFGQMVSELGAQGVRVVLWLTAMINDDSFDLEPGGDTYPGPASNYREALEQGYFVNQGQRFFWWKGTGGALDFFDRSAVRWWHRQQDPLLEMGVAGWKLDFGDSYVNTATVATDAGVVPHQAYSEAYYRDFFHYGVHKRGAEEFLTMVRAYDRSYQFEGRFYARKEHAPVAWMGDNRRDWKGLEDALDHMFRSAQAGYVVLGSDIGGYLDRDDLDFLEAVPFDVESFARWTAVGALSPFMQLHGRANITPWTVPERADEVVALYRYWSAVHLALVPYFYSLAEEAYAGGEPIVRPVGEGAAWPHDYRFHSGPDLLVAPFLSAGGLRTVLIPEGARYYDWWDLDRPALEPGATLTASAARDLRALPLFVREGAIIPLAVADARAELGDARSAGHLTVLLVPGAVESLFRLHDEDGGTSELALRGEGLGMSFRSSRLLQPALLKVRLPAEGARRVTVQGAAVPDVSSWEALTQGGAAAWLASATTLWVAVPAGESVEVRVE